jgi:TolA-binding protein
MPLLGALLTGVLLLGASAAAKAPVKKKPAASSRKKAAQPQAGPASAHKSYDDALALLKAKRYDEAEAQAKHCIDSAPDFADCHMALGAALAGMSRWDDAAKEYQTFLRLAPDHRLAPKVRENLAQYEEGRSQ